MDIITTGDFAITNIGGNTTASFRIPSIEKIDYAAEAQKLTKLKAAMKGKNKPRTEFY